LKINALPVVVLQVLE